MKSNGRMILTLSIFVILATTTYLAAYSAVVNRTPVYYGNNLRQLSLAMTTVDQDGTVRTVPPDPPDDYRVTYYLDNHLLYDLFRPAHWLDRRIRPAYWPEPTRRAGC